MKLKRTISAFTALSISVSYFNCFAETISQKVKAHAEEIVKKNIMMVSYVNIIIIHIRYRIIENG